MVCFYQTFQNIYYLLFQDFFSMLILLFSYILIAQQTKEILFLGSFRLSNVPILSMKS